MSTTEHNQNQQIEGLGLPRVEGTRVVQAASAV
jgi:hypothetical protein